MRIAHVTPYVFDDAGEVQDHVRNVAAELARRGHRIVVVAPARRRVELRDGRERLRALAAGRSSALDGPPGEPLVLAAGPALPLRRDGATQRVGLPVATSSNAALAIRHGGFDVVHVHEPGLPSAPFATTRRSSAICAATFHTASELALAYPFRSAKREEARARADLLIATSRGVLEAAEARYGPGDYRLLSSGVDVERLRPGLPVDPPRIVIEREAVDRPAVRALRRALADVPSEVLIIASRERDQAIAALAEATGFVASLEGSMQLALAAAAYGVPLLACEDAPAAELIEHERSGLRYPPGHPELAAAVVLRLIDDVDLRVSLRAGARRAAELRSYAAVAEELDDLYRGLAARRQHRTAPRHEAGETITADFHMHTRHSSDCATPVAALLDRAVALGLGAIAVTDHNTIAGGLEARRLAEEGGLPLTVIVGSEIMTDTQGEVIGLYLSEEIPRGLSFAETVERIHDQGGLVYIPHPFDRLHAIPSIDTLRAHIDAIDVLETSNGRLYFEADNHEAGRFAERWNLLGGAGSDAHVARGLFTAGLRLPRFEGPEELLLSLRSAETVRRPRSLVYLQGLKWARQLTRRPPAATDA